MAFYEGSISTTDVGAFVTTCVPLIAANANWSVVDSWDGYCRTLKCEDASIGCLFYVHINNNFAGYFKMAFWEGWDAVNHVGTGRSFLYANNISAYTPHMFYSSTYKMIVGDHHFSFINSTLGHHYWVGRPQVLFDETKNIVVITATWTQNWNPFGDGIHMDNGCLNAFLWDEAGVTDRSFKYTWDHSCITIGGQIIIQPSLIYNNTSKRIVGMITDSMCAQGDSSFGVTTGQTVSVGNEVWEAVFNQKLSFFKRG